MRAVARCPVNGPDGTIPAGGFLPDWPDEVVARVVSCRGAYRVCESCDTPVPVEARFCPIHEESHA